MGVLTKDLFREIKKSFGRFISIFFIVAIGVAFFAGVQGSAPIMKYSADRYFDDTNLMDIRVVSTWGLTEENIDAIKKVEGVSGVYPTHTMDVLTSKDTSQMVMKLLGVPENRDAENPDYINQLILTEGRYPEKSGECLIESSTLFENPLQIGDTIVLESGTDTDLAESLVTCEYTVVGSAQTSYYLSFEKGTSTIGSGDVYSYLYIPETDFIGERYTEVYLTVDGAKAENSYTDQYFEITDKVVEKLQALGLEQTDMQLTEQKEELQKALEEKKASYEAEKAKFDTAIKNAEKELEDGQFELLKDEMESAEAQLADAEAQLADAEMQIAQLQGPEWYVLDRNSHYSYMDYGSAADRMAGIAKLFPVIFLLVAVLVCLTTMTRMVDEQRGTIGTLKALGYSNGRIAGKYVSYAALASVTGSLLGCIVGTVVFPTVIYNVWRIMYVMPDITLQFQPVLLLGTTAVAVLITTLAAFVACYKELVETPALLMRPKSPKSGKKILLERIPILWNHLSFSKKVTARNIFRYKKRFFMTIVGIMGCTALLLAGFGISDSVRNIVDLQYGKVYQYDATIAYEAGLAPEEKEAFLKELQQSDWVESVCGVEQQSASVEGKDERSELTAIIVENPKDFMSFTSLHTRKTQAPLELTGNKVILTEKFASNEGISVGDTISLAIGDYAYVPVEVSGITEHYVGHYVYLTETCYRTLFHAVPDTNLILVKTVEMSQEEEAVHAQEVMERKEVSSISFYSGVSASFQDMVSSLTIITVVMVISAGLLAFVVLYNLTNVNISERLREIATIKVLGFYDKEVSAYVFRENIVLTIIGAVAGLFLGVWLHQFIMSMAELDTVMFGRSIDGISYVYSFLLTFVFSMFVNLFMESKLRKIPMVESLKSVE